MTKDLVTIAIPAYKKKWLNVAIESALSQDYKNIELLIVDDHSPQNLKDIVEPYLSDSRVKYFYNKKNLGKKSIVHNWNKCLEYAKGEFFVLLCDDDILLPNFVSVLLKLADKYPSCNVFHARRYIKKNNSEALGQEDVWPTFESSEEYTKNFLHGLRKHTVTEFLYRTDHIIPIGYQNFPVGFYSDNVSLMFFSKEGGIVSSDEGLMIFRESEIHISSNPKYNAGKALATRRFIKWVKKNVLIDDSIQIDIQRIENTSISYFYESQGWTKIKVMFCIPTSKQTVKYMSTYLLYLIKKKFRSFFNHRISSD